MSQSGLRIATLFWGPQPSEFAYTGQENVMHSEPHMPGATVPFATQEEMQFAPASLLDQLTCPPLPNQGSGLSQEGATTSRTDSPDEVILQKP